MSLSFTSARRNSTALYNEETGKPSAAAKDWILYPFYCCQWSTSKRRRNHGTQLIKVFCQSQDVLTKDNVCIALTCSVKYTESLWKEKFTNAKNSISNKNKENSSPSTNTESLLTTKIRECVLKILPDTSHEEAVKSTNELPDAVMREAMVQFKDTHITIQAIEISDVYECVTAESQEEEKYDKKDAKDYQETSEYDSNYFHYNESKSSSQDGIQYEDDKYSDEYDVIIEAEPELVIDTSISHSEIIVSTNKETSLVKPSDGDKTKDEIELPPTKLIDDTAPANDNKDENEDEIEKKVIEDSKETFELNDNEIQMTDDFDIISDAEDEILLKEEDKINIVKENAENDDEDSKKTILSIASEK